MNLRQELEAIRGKAGVLTPRAVLAEARKPKHPLHSRFEWDDSVAAERYRLEQAHELIVSVRIAFNTVKGKKADTRAFWAVRAADESEYEYEDIESVMADDFKRRLMVREMRRQIAELTARYRHFEEYWAMLRDELESGTG